MYNWNLSKIYPSLNDGEFKKDTEKVLELIDKALKIDYSKPKDIEIFKMGFKAIMEYSEILFNLGSIVELNLSVDSTNTDALKAYGLVQDLEVKAALPELMMGKYIKSFDNFMELVENDTELSKYKYYLSKAYNKSKRLLSDQAEILISKLEKSSGSAWRRLFDTLTSTVEVDYNGKIVTLPEIRNLAYDSDQKTRKEAYVSELNAYKKIDKSIAMSLSSIKQEVDTINEMRGFKSPIENTLEQSGMTKETLDALLSAIDDYLPVFRKYLKRKGEILGYKNGLPFFELFAPIGKEFGNFSVEESKNYLVSKFESFNTEISSMINKAYDNEWIDFMPKSGKVGGAFCEPQFKVKESRILTNFDGKFGSVVTLAHELGHAYHNECLWDYPMVYSDYPMQLAETASTFNETFIKDDAMKNAKSKDELLYILENSIQDDTQVVVDCISRYYFEQSVFENSKSGSLSNEELCDLMKKAQLRTYGDGLDPDYLHPYMWCCKSHYYSTGLSFYNFPYAFGQLFAYGLYQIYKEKGEEFFPLYKKILVTAGQMPIRECAMQAGIDTSDKTFWIKSLDLIKDKIELFLKETE